MSKEPGPESQKQRDGSRSPEDKDAATARPLWDADDDGYEMAEMQKDGRRLSDAEEEQVRLGAEEEEGDEDEERAPLAHHRRRRSSSVRSYKLYTPDEDARVRRKLDTRLVLFVALLYMMAFLDRSNIGL